MWTKIRLLLQEQSDLGLHCLLERLLKHFNRQQKQMIFVVIGVLRVKNRKYQKFIRVFMKNRDFWLK